MFKPDPRGLQVTLARLSAKADESLYVGDRPEVDATAAAEVGIPCAIITRPLGQHAYVSHIQVDGYPSLKRLVFGNENVTRSAVGFNDVP